MKLLVIDTEDYTLTVQADNVSNAFAKAIVRNDDMLHATAYIIQGQENVSIQIVDAVDSRLINTFKNIASGEQTHPVIFENKDYIFDIIFKTKTETEPVIYNQLNDTKKSFIAREIDKNWLLTGAINYGNDIGKTELFIKYKSNGVSKNHIFSFEVFPIKLDYKNDFNELVKAINKEFEALVLDLLKKTYSGYKEGDKINNEITWWSVFGALYKDILSSAEIIINKPHNRLVKETRYNKAEKLKYFTPQLEELVAENRHNESKYYREEFKTLTIDTAENRFVKYALVNVLRKFVEIKHKLFNQTVYKTKLSSEFTEELNNIEERFSVINRNPLFKQIGEYKGMKQESLVLQKAGGYSKLFRAWIILKKGIDFLDGVNRIELKNIAQLYQIWCFLEIKNIVSDILDNKAPEEINLAEILVEGFTIQLRSGNKSRVSFKTNDGQEIEIFHELKFSNDDKKKEITRSHTVNQEPDITVRIKKNDLKEDYQLTYLFDAKYRLESDYKTDGKDSPPEDSINQMHRYRDAIFYTTDNVNTKKEVIGGYVLFPGTGNINSIRDSYYYKSIEKINIGAFPLLPGDTKKDNNSIVKQFLSHIILNNQTSNILDRDVISQKGMEYEPTDASVLIGLTKSKEQQDYLFSGNKVIYHMPLVNKDGVPNDLDKIHDLKYFAPDIKGVNCYFKIASIDIKKRSDIFPNGPLRKESDELYYVFNLSDKTNLEKEIPSTQSRSKYFRYCKLSELFKLNNLSSAPII